MTRKKTELDYSIEHLHHVADVLKRQPNLDGKDRYAFLEDLGAVFRALRRLEDENKRLRAILEINGVAAEVIDRALGKESE
jgi:hypothetical protein